jgi:hypothetical protein
MYLQNVTLLGAKTTDTGVEDGNFSIMFWLIITVYTRADTIAKETQLSKPAAERLADEVIIVQNLKHNSNTKSSLAF